MLELHRAHIEVVAAGVPRALSFEGLAGCVGRTLLHMYRNCICCLNALF